MANNFIDYFLTVAGTVFRNINRNNSDSTDNMNPSIYWINKFNITFLRINWSNARTCENDKIVKSLKTKNSSGYYKIPPQKNPKIKCPFYHLKQISFLRIFPERL
jgi:hypothetical protein